MIDLTDKVCAELGVTPCTHPLDGGTHVTRQLLSTTVAGVVEELREAGVTKIYKVTQDRLVSPHIIGETVSVITVRCVI